jgi:long-chain acyl-CoA synthetase
MKIKRIFDLLERYRTEFSNKTDVFVAKEKGNWVKYSTKDYIENSNLFGLGLLKKGLKKGDTIATVSNNRPEWNFADIGMSMIGVIHVPIYPSISKDEYEHILKHSEAKILIVSDLELYNKLKPIADTIPSIQNIYTFDKLEGIKNWKEIIDLGKENDNEISRSELKTISDSITENDLHTIIYTSGTTGMPKGVMLTHKNFVYQMIYLDKLVSLDFNNSAISFLPLCHVLERIGNYTFQYIGLSIYYAESIEKVAENIKEVKPFVFVTVPRLLERVYDKILEKGKELKGIKKLLFFNAVETGLNFELTGKSIFYKMKLSLYNKIIFSKWREALGGNILMIISGGAALQERLAKVFTAAEIYIFEGYGLTETAPVICINHPNAVKFGTVGQKLAPEQEIKIADDGEILFKGPNLMPGYFKDDEKTAEAIDSEGWFHTGDIGKIEDLEFLKITDRKKEIFKLSTGKYVAPQVIENVMKESLFIDQIMICGENQKFTSAVISPNFEFLHEWCRRKKIAYRDNEDLVKKKRIIDRFMKEINFHNEKLGKTEQIKKIFVCADTWGTNTGELSPTLKLKRRYVKEKYQHEIQKFYKE